MLVNSTSSNTLRANVLYEHQYHLPYNGCTKNLILKPSWLKVELKVEFHFKKLLIYIFTLKWKTFQIVLK